MGVGRTMDIRRAAGPRSTTTTTTTRTAWRRPATNAARSSATNAASGTNGSKCRNKETDGNACSCITSSAKNMIGEQLYPRINQIVPKFAGKVTGMLLEAMETAELLNLLEDKVSWRRKLGRLLQF